ncbi:MAG: alanine--tRNA ligase [Planctomycetia bacterium]|nr:alanine--tRNA ligase [Planctomycetia bacterium]
MPTSADIRKQFIQFFVEKCGHTFVPSSPVVPLDDPTLLFTNAGMNQFKDVFLGTGSRPYKRAVNSQKCIRASGKHNDLEDVGRDTYHHTFFEMLGNWSFGDYYKADAIRWAWELLTKVWGIDKTRLHATVFGGSPDEGVPGDDEAAELWAKVTDINPKHIHRFGKKDNFWVMGETGPCGPCTEIHIDRTPDGSGGKLVNAGVPEVMEIWNLVFIQYNRNTPGGKLELLPAKHVDTGMGFERVTSVLQGVNSNYDTDVFTPLLSAISDQLSAKYTGKLDDPKDIAFRVLADHLRMLTFSLTDHAEFSNKGRGSVVRSVLRRAVRFGYQTFGQREPFLYKLVPAVVHQMGDAFPELKAHPGKVAEQIRGEEVDFLRTIDRGLSLFEEMTISCFANQVVRERKLDARPIIGGSSKGLEPYSSTPGEMSHQVTFMKRSGDTVTEDFKVIVSSKTEDFKRQVQKFCKQSPIIPGNFIFDLYTTFGFPPDLTRQMAQERWLVTDEAGFQTAMEAHEEKSRGKATTGQVALNVATPLPATDDRPKWSGSTGQATLLGWIADNQFVTTGSRTQGEVALILDRTCFYAESGGQVGDTGTISTEHGKFEVNSTTKLGNAIAHVGKLIEGKLNAGDTVNLAVSSERDFTRKNHTATHLAHWALQKVLGSHVEQRGSKVKPDEFTFDFSHSAALTTSEKTEVERLVNEKVYLDLEVRSKELPIAEAKKLPGVKAFFGDKYGDAVRVVQIGDGFSTEFCGGTHLDRTGAIGLFKIVGEEAVGKGIRRITAVTAKQAVEAVQNADRVLSELTTLFKCQPTDLPKRIIGLLDEQKKLKDQLKKGTSHDLGMVADKMLADAMDINGIKIITGALPEGVADEAVRTQLDRIRQKSGSCVIIVGWPVAEDKVTLIAAATEDVTAKGIHAGKLVGLAASIVGGKGGGKPTLAQAGGKDPSKLEEAIEAARNEAAGKLK